nr:energy transducer TonB [Pinirhizobacter soli]
MAELHQRWASHHVRRTSRLARTVVFGLVATLTGCAGGAQSRPPPGLPPTHEAAINLTWQSKHPPQYPREAVEGRHQGIVRLLVFVDAGNHVTDVKIDRSSGFAELDGAAKAAAWNWKFLAAARDGRPVDGIARVPVTFNLPGL